MNEDGFDYHKANKNLNKLYKNVNLINMNDIQKNSINDFINSGLLWYVNTILQVFGWVIVVEKSADNIFGFYPMRTKHRGFSETSNANGYLKVSKYMKDNAETLIKESQG